MTTGGEHMESAVSQKEAAERKETAQNVHYHMQ